MTPYQPDRSLKGKLRRQMVRLAHRRPLTTAPERPMISFTFDDAPATAATTGAKLLEARGLRGVYYVSGGLSGADGHMGPYAQEADYRRLAKAGHELACHTWSHLDCGKASASEVAQEVECNAKALARMGAGTLRNFAYPYGDVSAAPKRLLAARFCVLRALHKGVVEKGADLNQAPAVGIEGADGEAIARRWMGVAKQRNAWLILYTHDVRESPSDWGCTPDALERLIDEAVTGGFAVVTVAEGARRLGI
jgi:peptidoglycan/xylan/chitin deacetylase (PgdA/CDA1 family)